MVDRTDRRKGQPRGGRRSTDAWADTQPNFSDRDTMPMELLPDDEAPPPRLPAPEVTELFDQEAHQAVIAAERAGRGQG